MYAVVAVVAAGLTCPNTLYEVAIFLLSYIPPNSNAVGVGSVTIAANEAFVPSVVKNFPALPTWLGSASTTAQEEVVPFVVKNLPEWLVCDGTT